VPRIAGRHQAPTPSVPFPMFAGASRSTSATISYDLKNTRSIRGPDINGRWRNSSRDLSPPGSDMGFPIVGTRHLFGDVGPKRGRIGEVRNSNFRDRATASPESRRRPRSTSTCLACASASSTIRGFQEACITSCDNGAAFRMIGRDAYQKGSRPAVDRVIGCPLGKGRPPPRTPSA